MAAHPDEHILAISYRTEPSPRLVITHHDFGQPPKARDVQLVSTYCADEAACWNTRVDHMALTTVEFPVDLDDDRGGWHHLALVPR